MKKKILRGDLYYANLDPVIGSEQGGSRPVLIVQHDKGNTSSPTVIVLPITSQNKPSLPTHVDLFGSCGLTDSSIALAEQFRTIDKSRLSSFIGSVTDLQLSAVDIAMLCALGIPVDKPALPDDVVTLCSRCRQQYEDAEFQLRRISRENDPKDKCDYCNIHTGFDFEVVEQ
jgi:mRNA interferase MazF